MATLGFDTPGYALITYEDYAKNRASVVSALARATAKGIDYALQHPEEAVSILVQAAPELKANIEAEKWRATIPASTSAATKRDGAGALDRAKWESLNDLLKTYSVIEAKVDLDVLLKPYR